MADGSIRFNADLNTAGFESGAKRLMASTSTMQRHMQSAFQGLGGLIVGGGLVAGMQSVINQFSRVQDLATRFGTSAESIQRVGNAAKLSGTDIEQVATVLTKAGVAASKAATEGGAMADKFAEAGIDARAFADAALDEKLLMLSRAFEAAGGNADKTNSLIEILGTRGGANLLPLISNTAELNRNLAETPVLANESVKAIEEAGDEIDKATNAAWVGLGWLFGEIRKASERTGNLLFSGELKTIEELDQKLRGTTAAAPEAARSLAMVADEWSELADAPAGYEDAALKAHQAAIKAAEDEAAALAKVQQAWEDAQQAKTQQSAGNEQELRLMELEAADPAAAASQRDAAKALEMFPGTDEISAEQRRRFIAAQAALRASSGGGGGGGSSPSSQSWGGVAPSAAELRAQAALADDQRRISEMLADRNFGAASRAMQSASDRANAAQLDERVRGQLSESFGTRDFGSALDQFNRGRAINDRVSESEFRRMREEQAMTPAERQAAAEKAAGGKGGAAAEPPADPTGAKLDTIVKLMTERLPIRVLAA